MKKTIALFALVALFGIAGLTHADELPVQNGNGSPEAVVNIWGTTNSQLPQFAPGTSRKLTIGSVATCPFWFPMNCVDISGTAWYVARYTR